MNINKKVVTRMAPSPTGKFHVGGVRTALFNYLFARHHNGSFIIRSEDTDRERSKPQYEQNMKDVLSWLNLDYDAFYRQSDRTEIYQKHIVKLIESGKAYEDEASKDNPEQKVIRFKNPNQRVSFNDLILGDISFDTTELGDFVIARNIETPIYHLTVVVDDALMEISHIIRGQEHVNNTARQILILEALGFERPVYAHLPLIMSARGGKLSKRDPEVIPALEYQDLGILKEALINFLAYIGWNPGDEREIMTITELVADFDLLKVQKGGGVFNIEKLYWLNKQYLAKLSDQEFKDYLEPKMSHIESLLGFNKDMFNKILPLLRERTESYADIDMMLESGDLDYFFTHPQYEMKKLVWKEESLEDAQRHLAHVQNLIENYQGSWTVENLKNHIFSYADQEGRGSVLWPLRYCLSGKDKSPDPFTLLEILGREISLDRIKKTLV